MARTPRQIYEEYNILPALQLHQLRVAAVAKMICDNFKKPINANDVILACLFHDMGNIIKFDLAVFPEFLEPEGIKYWQGIQNECVKKYGTDHHAANIAIAKEIGLSSAILACIDAVAFARAQETLANGSWEEKICEYADTRVGPRGVLALNERLLEGRERYLARKKKVGISGVTLPQNQFDKLMDAERAIEKNVFEQTAIIPPDITDDAVAPLIEELQNYPVA